MKQFNLLVIVLTAATTAASLILVLLPLGVTAEDGPTKIKEPEIVVNGCRLTVRAAHYGPDIPPLIEVTSISENEAVQSVPISLKLSIEQLANPMSRVVTRAPSPTESWSYAGEVHCGPQKHIIPFHAGVRLHAFSSFTVNLAVRDWPWAAAGSWSSKFVPRGAEKLITSPAYYVDSREVNSRTFQLDAVKDASKRRG